MPLDGLDPDTLNDFVTESSELIDSLDENLVALEQEPEDDALVNEVFRSLHTIKGAASFLALDALTEVAHAAEDVLNLVRRNEATVSQEMMSLLLNAVDIIRTQIDEVSDGTDPSAAPPTLVSGLRAIEGSAPAPTETEPAAEATNELNLPANKLDLLPFMADDVQCSVANVRDLAGGLESPETRAQVIAELKDTAAELLRTVAFFELEILTGEVQCFSTVLDAMSAADEPDLGAIMPRLDALLHVIDQRAAALRDLGLIELDTTNLVRHLSSSAMGDDDVTCPEIPVGAQLDDVLVIEGVIKAEAPAADADGDEEESAAATPAREQKASKSEQTIRVDVARLESLLNLIGELVLQKNRVLGLSRRFCDGVNEQPAIEEMQQVASDLDRVTADLQAGVMKTRLQPVSRLFSRYPRVIRDLARATGKEIDITITGGETEVDKSVIEALADPLVHILRNSADHGVESPEEREAAGKPARGTIEVAAQHMGNHVRVSIMDDGRGIDPDVVSRKALEKGLVDQAELDAMTDNQKVQFVFAPGFSTAQSVSNLSGRGVGMDVVNTNIAKLNGSVSVDSVKGRGTTVTITIPLTIAIMQALILEVVGEYYAVPLNNIEEIVRPGDAQRGSVNGVDVLRLRDDVIPLIDLADVLSRPAGDDAGDFAVIANTGDEKAGLLVNRLVGQREIVIKPLDDMFSKGNAISGATVLDDGRVSLILDTAQVVSKARMARPANPANTGA